MSEDEPILICVAVNKMDDPGVPSTIEKCTVCDCDVWVSEDSADVVARRVCTSCGGVLISHDPEGTENRVLPRTRERLHSMGYADEQIDFMIALYGMMLAAGIVVD